MQRPSNHQEIYSRLSWKLLLAFVNLVLLRSGKHVRRDPIFLIIYLHGTRKFNLSFQFMETPTGKKCALPLSSKTTFSICQSFAAK